MGAAKHDWPPCGATTTNRNNRYEEHCRAPGNGYGGRCHWHGGVEPPPGDWAILYTRSGIYLWNRGADEKQRVSWDVAAKLVETGHVKRGLFYRQRTGKSLLERLERRGVERRQVAYHTMLREYEFEVRA